MNQTTNTAATTLEQVNAMPAATWGWLKMNQTKLELSDELAAAPAEAVEVDARARVVFSVELVRQLLQAGVVGKRPVPRNLE